MGMQFFFIFVQVYDTQNGSMVDMLRGHKSTVYCVDYANDGRSIGSIEVHRLP